MSNVGLVSTLVRYYLKKNPSVNIQKGYGGLNAS